MTFPTAATEDFLYACSELRKLGATHVRMGELSARFEPTNATEPQPDAAHAATIPAPPQKRERTKSEPKTDVPVFPEDTPDDVARRRQRQQLTELVSGT